MSVYFLDSNALVNRQAMEGIVETMTATAEVAELFGLTESKLFQQGLISLMREKKRQTLQLKLEILARYGASSFDDLESRIARGQVVEHPAWEDLIVAENLTARLGELDSTCLSRPAVVTPTTGNVA